MSRPSWDEMSLRLAEADALKEKSGLAYMHTAHGRRTHATCGGCVHLLSFDYRSGHYFKCQKYGVTHGAATDWRKKFEACGLFEKKTTQTRELTNATTPTTPA